MAVPRNRHSNARKNTKRAHDAKVGANVLTCSNCQSSRLSHRACPSCGFYNGKSLFEEATTPAE